MTTTANQQVRLCRMFTFWRLIRLIGSSTWCIIAGFVPFTGNLFMKRENLAVSSQYPPCPYVESFPCQSDYLVPPRCISVSKNCTSTSLVLSSLSFSIPASSTSMITVVPSARRQWLPLAELTQPAQQSRIYCFSLLVR